MLRDAPIPDLLAVVMAGLLGASILQLGGPWGLPLGLTAPLAVLAATGVLVWHSRSRGENALPFVSRSRAAWLLAGLLIVALLLRVNGLMNRPAWEDEMWTLRNIYSASYLELLRVAADDYWPPLHYLILNTLVRFTDTGLFWLRVPSVVFGVITVGLVFWVGTRFFRSRFAGLAAAAVLTGATAHVLYSQEARVYALLMMLTVLSAYFFLKSYQEKRISPAYVVVTTLMVYSHSFVSWYFIAAQSVYVLVGWLLWRDRRAFLKGFLSQLLVLLLWVPVVVAFLYARAARGIEVPTKWATGVNDNPGLFDLVELYQGLAVRSWAGAAFMALLLAIAALPLLTRAGPDRPNPHEEYARGFREDGPEYFPTVLFLVCWLAVPPLFSLGVTWFTELDTFGAIRYHLPVLPGVALMAGGGFLFLRSRAAVLSAAAILVLLPVAELPSFYRDFNRPAIDEAVEIVRENETGAETIYVGNSFRVFQYYYRGIFPRIGSPQWDSLTAAHAHQTDRHTTFESKWGDTYAYEKMMDRLHHFAHRWLDGYREQIREELDAGGFQEPYWIVMQQSENEDAFFQAFDELQPPCTRLREYRVRGAIVWHCRGPEADDPSPGGLSGP
ncbi:MAG TPA: glycosyltransferase family 39 protein [Longimicrobiales bacterium]|nr:glycosyltransferase family 39 protein [Longimicrobiales bacterium]